MKSDDRERIEHILESCREAQEFIENKSRSDLHQDRKLELALNKEIEIIGEAAAQLSDETREKFDEIPWKEIIGMRNKLIHDYEEVRRDIIWRVVTKDLPELIKELED